MSAHDDAMEAAANTGCIGGKCNCVCSPCMVVARDAVTAYLTVMLDRGWKLTPREATADMIRAAVEHWSCRQGPKWQAVWDAAPSAVEKPDA